MSNQLTISDLKERFHVADTKWIVFTRNGKVDARTLKQSSRSAIETNGGRVLFTVSGCSRRDAVRHGERTVV
jgi:hypothetical protein